MTVSEELWALHSKLKFEPYPSTADKAKSWEQWFPGISPQKLYDSLASGLKDNPPRLRIYCKDSNPQTDEACLVVSSTDKSKGTYHTEITLKPSGLEIDDYGALPTGHGNATHVLKWLADFALATGRKKMELTACSNNGAYSWARFGFTPTRESWERLKEDIKTRLAPEHDHIYYNASSQDVPMLYALEQNNFRKFTALEVKVINMALASSRPESIQCLCGLGDEMGRIPKTKKQEEQIVTPGKALLCGLSWHGTLDLGNPDILRQFNAYVTRPVIAKEQGGKHEKT